MPTPQHANTEMPQPDIGANLKSMRHAQGLSLAKLASLTGISDATLSRVETGKTLVSAHNLYTLSKTLHVDITAFYEPDASPLRSGIRSIARNGLGHEMITDRFVTTVLAGDLANKQMHPSLNVITAQTLEEAGGLIGHMGEEFIMVQEGRLILHSEHYAPVFLETGDSIYFDGSMPHAYLSGDETPARILVIMSMKTHAPTGDVK